MHHAQDARDPVKALSSMQDAAGGKCKVHDVKQSGNVVSFTMTCGDDKDGSIDMTASFTFENARHYTGQLQIGDVGRRPEDDIQHDGRCQMDRRVQEIGRGRHGL